MKLDMESCRRRLAILWFSAAFLIFAVVLGVTLAGYYDDDSELAWAWFLPSIMPTLSLIVGVLVAEARQPARPHQLVTRLLYTLSFRLSAFYLLLVAVTFLAQPVATISPLDLLDLSHIWLGPVQGLVSLSLGAFFVQTGGDKTSEQGNPPA